MKETQISEISLKIKNCFRNIKWLSRKIFPDNMHRGIKNKLLQLKLNNFSNRAKIRRCREYSGPYGPYVNDIHNGVFIIKVFDKLLQKHNYIGICWPV